MHLKNNKLYYLIKIEAKPDIGGELLSGKY